jgi:predicted TPR repeat methyltransferase
LRHVDRACNVARGHSVGAATNQQAKRFEACFLSKGSKATGRNIRIHISRLFDIYLDRKLVTIASVDYPRAIADIYSEIACAEDVPIADIGCGTGLVAEQLKMSRDIIDGFDVSPEMPRLAEDKSIYRSLCKADLTGSLDAFNFGELIEKLRSDSKITHTALREILIYSKTDHEHGSDVALALIFRKSE